MHTAQRTTLVSPPQYHHLSSSHHAVNQQMYKLSFFIINYAIHTINNKQTSTIFKIKTKSDDKNIFIMLQMLMTAAMACCMVLRYLEMADL
jgi:hypothetical protein